jgi:hypothetical protein
VTRGSENEAGLGGGGGWIPDQMDIKGENKFRPCLNLNVTDAAETDSVLV